MRYCLLVCCWFLLFFLLSAQNRKVTLTQILQKIEEAYRVRIAYSPTITNKIIPSGEYRIAGSGNLQSLFKDLKEDVGVTIVSIGSVYVMRIAPEEKKPLVVHQATPKYIPPPPLPRDTLRLPLLPKANPELDPTDTMPAGDTITLAAQPLRDLTPVRRGTLHVNMLGWMTGAMNMGVYYALAPRFTAGAEFVYSPLEIGLMRFKYMTLRTEVRYWLDTSNENHFLSATLQYSRYNVGGMPHLPFFSQNIQNNRYEGNLGAVGLGYGYSRKLRRNVNLEFEFAGALFLTGYAKYPCLKCGNKLKEGTKLFIAPEKIAMNLVFFW